MKSMNREFTLREKLLLLVLALVLVGLVYYQFVDKNVRGTLAGHIAEADQLQADLDIAQAQLMHLTTVQSSLNAVEEAGKYGWMGSYNSSKEELAFLNGVLADTLQYSISFANVTRSGNQIRRSFTLQYQARNYTAAQEILTNLLRGKYRCLVGDVNCTIAADGTVTMNQSATFYETMVGGTPDAALPRDSAAANS
ncbi:MAG: hypothetical protein IJH09_07465 [Clostridia bacterium]|nr:hypothetical protein [Clostridia bacterium]